MKDRPILFSAPMIRAIIADRKTQTRRIVNGKWRPVVEEVLAVNGKRMWRTNDHELTTPYGNPGDRLWVREAFYHIGETGEVFYRATADSNYGDELKWPGPWKPSIHMPKWASRITLGINDIRVERLQDISEADAAAEGCAPLCDPDDDEAICAPQTCRSGFRILWDEINAHRGCGWDVNPWVWVVNFNRIAAS